MVQMTMQVSEELAERLRPIGSWLPTVLELSLVGFKTVAAATATEVIQFLSQEPTPQNVLDYHVSERAQARLQRLLALNAAGLLGEAEQLELDEMQRIEHIVIMLKAQIAGHRLPGCPAVTIVSIVAQPFGERQIPGLVHHPFGGYRRDTSRSTTPAAREPLARPSQATLPPGGQPRAQPGAQGE